VKRPFLLMALALPAAYVLAETYTYDDLGRLRTVKNGSVTTTYTYDSADNRITVQSGAPVTNQPPVCSSQTFPLTGIPPQATATDTITAAKVLARCSDPDGDPMTVTAPIPLPYTVTIPPGQNKVVPFSVSDGKGGTGSGTFSYIRP